MFFSYSAGMAFVLMTVSLSAALTKGRSPNQLHGLLPYLHSHWHGHAYSGWAVSNLVSRSFCVPLSLAPNAIGHS